MEKLFEDIGMGARMSFILARQLLSDQAVSEISRCLKPGVTNLPLVIREPKGDSDLCALL